MKEMINEGLIEKDTKTQSLNLLDRFKSQLICLELVSQTGRLGGKLLSYEPNPIGELKRK